MKKFSMIVGANRNIGLALADKFASEGEHIMMTGRTEKHIIAAADGLRKKHSVDIRAVTFSQEQSETIDRLFDDLDAKDILVHRLVLNAASPGAAQEALGADAAQWFQTVKTNLLGGFLLARACAKRLIEAKSPGSILFIGSNTSRRAIPNRSDYIASKGGLCSLTKALAVEWGGYGIRVNILMPGSVHTDRWDALDAETLAYRNQRAPLKRAATCAEVASLAYFLSGDDSANTTGAEFVTDAGMDALLFMK